jgi:riboflavin kinase/FMN adenylyltransferase
MRVEFELPENGAEGSAPVALAIGSFDGVHIGHQRVLESVVERAKALAGEPVVLTFEPHPRCVLDPEHCPPSLTTLDEKHDRLAAFGIERMIVLPFTKGLSRLSAERFCERLTAAVNLKTLVIGHDFALGAERRGDATMLRSYGADHGFEVVPASAARDGYQPISSSRIRVALLEGDIDAASRLLGYPFFADAWVEHGEGIGARIGFPTANLAITPNKCLPGRGVYATWTKVRGTWHVGATNVGYRPTFGGETLTVETYLLDFDEDIYREKVRTVFVVRLRDERMYPDADALCEQIDKDVAKTRVLVGGTEPPQGL